MYGSCQQSAGMTPSYARAASLTIEWIASRSCSSQRRIIETLSSELPPLAVAFIDGFVRPAWCRRIPDRLRAHASLCEQGVEPVLGLPPGRHHDPVGGELRGRLVMVDVVDGDGPAVDPAHERGAGHLDSGPGERRGGPG